MTQQLTTALASTNSARLTKIARYVIAQVITSHTRLEINSDEIIEATIINNALWVDLTNNWVVPIHIELFRFIRRQQLERLALVEADMGVGNVISQSVNLAVFDSKHCGSSSYHCSLDTDGSYRVWHDEHYLGIMHQRADGTWAARSIRTNDIHTFSSSEAAQSYLAWWILLTKIR